MKRHALMVILLGAIALVAPALAPPGGAAAQSEPTMVVSPSSGPCDGTVELRGSGYPADADIRVSLGRPHSEGDFAVLASALTGATGDFHVAVDLGSLGCEAAALDERLSGPGVRKYLFILAYVPPAPFMGGQRTLPTPTPRRQWEARGCRAPCRVRAMRATHLARECRAMLSLRSWWPRRCFWWGDCLPSAVLGARTSLDGGLP
jgi:hypothetical protein